MNNPLLDLEFLKKLDLQKKREIYAKITLLTLKEEPVYEFQGKITQGSINIDGNSAVRRTCSLTMITKDFESGNVYWGLKNKFKLAVGVKNDIDLKYPKIIWFPQGMYIFTQLNETVNTNGYTITISGKDKMCQLNGEVGGTITAETDFGKWEYYDDDGIKHYEDIPIETIVKNIVSTFGNIPLHKIILNDIDQYAVELLRYKGDSFLYLFKNVQTGEITNITFNEDTKVIIVGDKGEEEVTISSEKIQYDSFTSTALETYTPTIVKQSKNGDYYTIVKLDYDDDIGYRSTILAYPGDLIAKVGETITSILDKIKNIFSDFEYFYDINGNFIFQKKRTYVNESWNNLIQSIDGIYADPNAYSSAITYSFNDNILLSSFANQPNFLNLKNDFSIWGQRKTSSGAQVPIHMRYAIMKKPKKYKAFNDITYIANKNRKYIKKDLNNDNKITTIYCDWRELIYQMAKDYYSEGGFQNPNFQQSVKEKNPNEYPTGITGYESFYADMQGFWRQLYDVNISSQEQEKYSLKISQEARTEEEWLNCREELLWGEIQDFLDNGTPFDDPCIKIRYYYREKILDEEQMRDYKLSTFELMREYLSPLPDNFRAVYSPQFFDYNPKISKNKELKEEQNLIKVPTSNESIQNNSVIENKKYYVETGWNTDVYENPSALNFWIDFMDTDGEIGKYSMDVIGSRQKVINSNDITSVYFKDVPNVLIGASVGNDNDIFSGYTKINLPQGTEQYFAISPRKKSAKDELDSLLYQHTYTIESVTLTSLPIYYLQPNTRIFISDNKTKVNGEYIVTKISIPLTYNGTSSISATRAVERIY